MKFPTNFAAIPKTQVQAWARGLLDPEKQIKQLNDAKAAIYKRVRTDHSPAVKEGLQAAIKFVRMEPGQRLQAEAAQGYAGVFLGMIEDTADAASVTEPLTQAREEQLTAANCNEPPTPAHEDQFHAPVVAVAMAGDLGAARDRGGSHGRGFDAWRAERHSDRAKPFTRAHKDIDHDPETGEILEPGSVATVETGMTEVVVVRESLDSLEEPRVSAGSSDEDQNEDELQIKEPAFGDAV